jgi:hypothetical protein
MPNVYKVLHEDSSGNVILYASDASIVNFDPTKTRNMSAMNVQNAIVAVNEKAEGKAEMLSFTTVIRASAFEGATAPYTQTIEVLGLRGTDVPDIGVRLSDVVGDALAQRESFGCITKIETGNGYIVVKCFEDKPSVDIPIFIRVVR